MPSRQERKELRKRKKRLLRQKATAQREPPDVEAIKEDIKAKIETMSPQNIITLKNKMEAAGFTEEKGMETLAGVRQEMNVLSSNLAQVDGQLQDSMSKRLTASPESLSMLDETEGRLKEIQGEIQKLSTEHEALANEIAALWKRMKLPPKPISLGDYLHGLLVCSELRSRELDVAKEKGTPASGVSSELIQTMMKNYSFRESKDLLHFGDHWRGDGYARVSVGHKLTSALMLTSVPDDMEVQAPWKAWVLEMPDGLYPFNISPSAFKEAKERSDAGDDSIVNATTGSDGKERGDEIQGQVRALICYKSNPVHLIVQVRDTFLSFKVTNLGENFLSNFSKGVCLTFHDRKHVQERNWGGGGSKREVKEPGQGRYYVFSKPIQVDFRDEVRALLSGVRKGQSPKVQFIVRGHFRDQACGKEMKDHRKIWLQPYWKGPEEARVLLRGYNLSGSPPQSD